MKKTLLFLFTTGLHFTGLLAQCPAGDVTLSNQAEVDAYPIDFSCTQVGTLYIGSPGTDTDINDLSALSSIEEVTNLRIYNTNLVSLSGLDNLTTISEDLEINTNELLQNLSGLENLQSVGDDFEIKNNEALSSIANLTSLTQIVDDLEIENNIELTSISALSNISGTIDDLKIIDLPKLNNLVGLEGIDTITDDIELQGLPLVPNLNPLSNITSVSDNIEIIDLNITSLSPLSNITSEITELILASNPSISSLDGLQNILGVDDGLILDQNEMLADISQISFVDDEIDDVFIFNNNLNSLAELSAITEAEYIEISEPNITSLNGLQNLVEVSDEFIIFNNPEITSLAGLENLESVNDIIIVGNEKLSSFDGLDSLSESTIGNIIIADNTMLTSVTGFNDAVLVSSLTLSGNNLNNIDTFGKLRLLTSTVDFSFIEEENLETINLFSLRSANASLTVTTPNLMDACGLSSYIQFGDASTQLAFNGGTNWPNMQSIIDNCDYCPTGTFGFDTQQDFIDFTTNLSCTDLSNTSISLATSGITSLSPLNSVTGLRDLTLIDTGIQNFDGLEALEHISGDLQLFNNTELLQVDALSNLTSLANELIIISNTKLNSLSGLSNLEGTLHELNIEENTVLPNLNGLERITTIENDLEIASNPMLSNLSGLSGLITVGDDVEIHENTVLADLDGLNELTTVGDGLEIYENPILSDITALSKVTGNIGDLTIYENNLASLNGLQAITKSIDVEIAETSLMNLSGLSGLLEIDEFAMELTPIVDFTGVNANLQITNEINISDNPELTSLNGLPQQTTPTVGFSDNPKLASINTFDNITEMRSLQLSGNAIVDLDTFSNLETVSTGLPRFRPPTIIEEANLETINLTSLQTIEEELRLETPSLLDACGLFNFVENGNGLDKLDIIDGGFSGVATPQDIIDFCESTLETEDFNIASIQFFPNPTKDFLTISGLKQKFKYNVVSISGNLLETSTTENHIDLSQYTSGIYFIEIGGNVIKVIKSK